MLLSQIRCIIFFDMVGFTDFTLSRWLVSDVGPVLGWLHHVNVDVVTNVPEVYVA